MDSWFLVTAVGTGVAALLLALWLSSRISRPLADLAAKTAVLDLDRLDVRFDGGTDEVGSLSRLLGDLASRLRTSTARVREAERRATVGDLARQINHDIKNGLIPLRNVIRHLEQVERDEPASLPSVFAERRPDSRFQHRLPRDACDQLPAAVAEPGPTRLRCERAGHERWFARRRGAIGSSSRCTLQPNLPPVAGDPIAFRRILENLTANAVESLESKPGRVSVSTEMVERDGERPSVRVTVARHGPRNVQRGDRPDFQRFLHDEGRRHRSWLLHRAAAGDGSARRDRRRERARQRDAHHRRYSFAQSGAQMTTQVLVVDDVPAMAEQYAYDLKRVGKYDAIVAAGGEEALDILAREPIDCVVLDLEMPGTDGFEVLRSLQQRGIETPVIVYTGAGSYDRCVQAVRLGAYGFVDKAEPIERVVQEIENAVSRGRMVKELRSLRSRFDGETSLIGDSAPMRALRAAIARVAPIPSGVLIVG